MATKIVTKNSSTASAVPTASDLVQGELAVNVADKRLFTEDNAGAIVELGTNPSTLTVTGEITANGGIALGDNDKATFGASDDLQIYHDGSNSWVKDSGDGVLALASNGNGVGLYNADGTKPMVFGTVDSDVKIYHNGLLKLATTASGIDVTGTVTADGLTVNSGGTSSSLSIRNGNNNSFLNIYSDLNGVALLDVDGNNVGANPRFQIDLGNVQTFRITEGGDISFYEDTGTTPKFFWDASAESLGIGTDSPTAKLTLNDAGQQVGIDFKEAGTTRAHIEYDGAIPALELGTNGAANVVLKTSNTERMRIDANGKIFMNEGVPFAWTDGSLNVSADIYGDSSDNLVFRNTSAKTERARIDSSGNLLIGKTTTGVSGAGTVIRAGGELFVTRAGDVMNLNRLTSDGDIAVFRKDGAAVGSIGTYVNLPYIGKADVNLLFDPTGPHIIPRGTNGGARDAAINLGASTNRFKDIYLSGGVYLGGTGAANKLDDYEEGAWTPALSNIGSGTYTVQVGRYTKIGSLVIANFHLDINALGSAAGQLIVTGLPFNASSFVANYGSCTTTHAGGWDAGYMNLGGLVNGGTTTFTVYYQNSSGNMAGATHAQMQTGNFLGTIIYEAA